MKRPDTLIEVVAAATANEAFWAPAFAGFLDTFYMEPGCRQAMIDPEPPMTGDAVRDAYLAAAAEHLANSLGRGEPDACQARMLRARDSTAAPARWSSRAFDPRVRT